MAEAGSRAGSVPAVATGPQPARALADPKPAQGRVPPLVDPGDGDFGTDAGSPRHRSMLQLTGSLLVEISLAKLLTAWLLLVILPALVLGLVPMVVSAWVAAVTGSLHRPLAGVGPALVLAAGLLLAWLGGRPLLRLAEGSFWSLASVVVEPGYIAVREALRHLAEGLFPRRSRGVRLARLRSAAGLVGGLLLSAAALGALALAWPGSRWVGTPLDLASPHLLAAPALANSVVVIAGYLAVAAVVSGVADALTPPPRTLRGLVPSAPGAPVWRVAHLSDVHVVGERFGYRIESGRAGPRGNARVSEALARLDALAAETPLDLVLMTGDLTDAGTAPEWAELLDALAARPALAARVLMLPGNHDLNIVDRANPARFDLPSSPGRRLRKLRTLSAMVTLQGGRVRLVDRDADRLGPTLAEAVAPHREALTRFAGDGAADGAAALVELWARAFPLVAPPATADGLGVVLLISNADAHFSFTNALGLISAEQLRGIGVATAAWPRARWIVALHHHLVEYPRPAARRGCR
jgi:hypothetical protein